MKIAQIAPLYESVPPRLYGGTERVVSFLTEELVEQGHEVTLFASGDSRTQAELFPVVEQALRLGQGCRDPLSWHIQLLDEIARRAGDFDILHFHIDYLHFPLMRLLDVPHLTTLHGRQDLPDLAPLYRHFPEMPVVSISDAQRHPLPEANWQATVYNGIPERLLPYSSEGGDYLAFVGRMSPEKRPDRAIEIALRSGLPIRLAAKVDKVDEDYFENRIKPLLSYPGVDFIGEIDEHEKADFLGQARALLFPIDWPEPFGLVMIEALACGTPVVAYRQGSVPEIVEDGRTGFIVDDIESAVTAVDRLDEIDRRDCRDSFERRFSARRMATDYLRVYERLAEPRQAPRLVG